MKRILSLSRVYRLLEPGPVVRVTTARKGRANVTTLSWNTMMDFEPPLVGCVIDENSLTFTNLKATKECAINIPTVETARRYDFFILEAPKAWIGPTKKTPRTLHHRGRGGFMVAGRALKLPSRIKQGTPPNGRYPRRPIQ